MSWQRIVLYTLAMLSCAGIITVWNLNAQRRRFKKAYAQRASSAWKEADKPFLEALTKAFKLPKAWGVFVPPEATPMSLYLTLYPEHCIYDNCELGRFLRALRERKVQLPDEPLSLSFSELARRWRDASSTVAQN